METEHTRRPRTKRLFPIAIFVTATVVGALLSLFFLANDAGQVYRTAAANQLTNLRSATNTIDKNYSRQETIAFSEMRTTLANYEKQAPRLKKIWGGAVMSKKYKAASRLDSDYRAMLNDYQSLIAEYFDNVVNLKNSSSLSATQKSYLEDFGSRLDAVKERRRNLETAISRS